MSALVYICSLISLHPYSSKPSSNMSETESCDRSQAITSHELPTDSVTEFLSGSGSRGINKERGGRRKSGGQIRANKQNFSDELQTLRGKLAEHEETMGKLKAAFGMISIALDIQPHSHQPASAVNVDSFLHGGYNAAASSTAVEMPSNRRPRMSRNSGIDFMGTDQRRNYSRGGGRNYRGGFRGSLGNFPAFSSREDFV